MNRKPILFCAGIFFCALMISGSFAFAKTKNVSRVKSFVASNAKELILEIPQMGAKDEPEVVKVLRSSGGITFEGYCERMHIVMFLVDTDLHDNYNFIDTAMIQFGFSYNIKTGATISQVKDQCGMNVNVDPASSQQ